MMASFLEKLELVLHGLQHCVKHGMERNEMDWIGVEWNGIISSLELNRKWFESRSGQISVGPD